VISSAELPTVVPVELPAGTEIVVDSQVLTSDVDRTIADLQAEQVFKLIHLVNGNSSKNSPDNN
jgi:hypothetical protein